MGLGRDTDVMILPREESNSSTTIISDKAGSKASISHKKKGSSNTYAVITTACESPKPNPQTPSKGDALSPQSKIEIFLSRVIPRFLEQAEHSELPTGFKKSRAGVIRLRSKQVREFITEEDLKYLPPNIRAHVIKYGIRFSKFPNYSRKVRTADLYHRVELILDATKELLAKFAPAIDWDAFKEKNKAFIKKHFDVDAIIKDKDLSEKEKLKKLKKVYRDFKEYLKKNLATELINLVLSRYEHDAEKKAAVEKAINAGVKKELYVLKGIFQAELEVLANKGRPFIINIDPDNKTISGEVGIMTNEDGTPVITSCYDRNNSVPANALLRCNAHLIMRDGVKAVKVDSTGFRTANFAPTNRTNIAEIIAETVSHLESFVRATFATNYFDMPQDFANAGSKENPIVFKLSTQSLLSMLSPELENMVDKQRQREQVMAVFHACEILKQKSLAIKINGKTIYVRPDVRLEINPINVGRYATTPDIKSDSVIPDFIIRQFLKTDELAPKQAELVRLRALLSMLRELPALIARRYNDVGADLDSAKKIKKLFDAIFDSNSELTAALEKCDNNWKKIQAMYAALRLDATNANQKIAELERLQLEQIQFDQAVLDIYKARFEKLQSQKLFESHLDVLEKKCANPDVLAFYNTAQNIYALLDFNFSKTQQSLDIPNVGPVNITARKNLDPKYTGFAAVVVAELSDELGYSTNKKCFDGNDRTGKIIQEEQDHQVFKRQNQGRNPRHYCPTDLQILHSIHTQRQYTDASLYTTKLTAGAIGREIHHRDGSTYNDAQLQLNRHTLAKPFTVVHDSINPLVQRATGLFAKFLLAASLFFGLAAAGTASSSVPLSNLPQLASSGSVTNAVKDEVNTNSERDLKDAANVSRTSCSGSKNSSSRGSRDDMTAVASDEEFSKKYAKKVAASGSRKAKDILPLPVNENRNVKSQRFFGEEISLSRSIMDLDSSMGGSIIPDAEDSSETPAQRI